MNALAKSIAVGVLIALLGVGVFGRFYSARFGGLILPGSLQAAEIASHVRQGEGLMTSAIYPLALRYAAPNAEGAMPSLWGGPVYSYALSLLFHARGAGDASVSLFNGLMLLLTGLVIYAIGRGLWDRTAGLLSAALFFVSVDAIGHALTGSGATFAGLLVTLAIWAAVRSRNAAVETIERDPERRPSIVWPAVTGAFLGIAWLSGLTSMLLAIPLALLASVGSPSRLRSIGVFAAAMVIVLAPWGVRNVMVAGTPLPPLATYELLTNTEAYPGLSIYQQMPSEAPSVLGFAFSNPRQIGEKMIGALIQVYRGGPGMLTPYLFPFLILAAFIFGRTDFRRSIWRAMIAIFVLQAISLSVFSNRLDGLAVVMPIAVVLAAGALVDVLRRMDATKLTRGGIAAAIFLLVLFPTATSMIVGDQMPPARSRANLGLIKEGLTDDAVILTNDPAAVAWYSNKSAILLPHSPDALAQLEQRGLGHHYFYVSRARSATVPEAALTEWVEAVRTGGVQKFGQVARLAHPELFLEVEAKRTTPTG